MVKVSCAVDYPQDADAIVAWTINDDPALLEGKDTTGNAKFRSRGTHFWLGRKETAKFVQSADNIFRDRGTTVLDANVERDVFNVVLCLG